MTKPQNVQTYHKTAPFFFALDTFLFCKKMTKNHLLVNSIFLRKFSQKLQFQKENRKKRGRKKTPSFCIAFPFCFHLPLHQSAPILHLFTQIEHLSLLIFSIINNITIFLFCLIGPDLIFLRKQELKIR